MTEKTNETNDHLHDCVPATDYVDAVKRIQFLEKQIVFLQARAEGAIRYIDHLTDRLDQYRASLDQQHEDGEPVTLCYFCEQPVWPSFATFQQWSAEDRKIVYGHRACLACLGGPSLDWTQDTIQ